MVAQILFRAVVGSEPLNHPEILAFRHRFDLMCSNGFRFTEVCCFRYLRCNSLILSRCSSHSLAAVNHSWQRPIHLMSHVSSFETLYEHLDSSNPVRTEMEPIRQVLGIPLLSLTTILLDFLHGKGAPCTQLLSSISVHFPSVVNLTCIGEDGFWAKHFCWAVNRTYEWELGALQIKMGLHHVPNLLNCWHEFCLGQFCWGQWSLLCPWGPPFGPDNGCWGQNLLHNMLSEHIHSDQLHAEAGKGNLPWPQQWA